MPPSTDQAHNLGKSEINSAIKGEYETEKALNAILTHLNDLRSARPTIQIGNGRTDRTRNTIERILKAAHKVFTKNGHAGLSLRKVADEAGIAVGNLTYHFPTKNSLIDAMMREALTDYVEEHLSQFEAGRDTPLEILLNVVEFYVRNARESHQFFYQLWGFAGSGEEAREMVRELYRPIGRFIYYLVRAANPKLTDTEVRQAVLQIFSLEEGYKLFIGMGPDTSPAIQSAERDIRAITKRIIQAA
ncbi:TetR/AcrR family transcriptional regulator [Hyphococcus sp.]|uniref:TetR/AcrR family transcriptional regulator n=1 Tax=Hyphococcus sp. TaxID=2038636 RepID=UPI003D120E67